VHDQPGGALAPGGTADPTTREGAAQILLRQGRQACGDDQPEQGPKAADANGRGDPASAAAAVKQGGA
jgi:hypothetical protein